jgi:hypothetical protein
MIHLFVLLFWFQGNSVPNDLKSMRDLFPMIDKGEKYAKQLFETSKNTITVKQSTRLAYNAAGEMAVGSYKFNPISKLNAFSTGKKKLDACLKLDSTDLESRYIRYTIQCEAPSFLGYTKNKTEDNRYLTNHVEEIRFTDKELYAKIVSFFIYRKGKGK